MILSAIVASSVMRYASGIHIALGKYNVFHVRLPSFERSGLCAISFLVPVISHFGIFSKPKEKIKTVYVLQSHRKKGIISLLNR
jgi:hypothetical protein